MMLQENVGGCWSSVTVNMASGQNMGVAGDVKVNFKIGRKVFIHT